MVRQTSLRSLSLAGGLPDYGGTWRPQFVRLLLLATLAWALVVLASGLYPAVGVGGTILFVLIYASIGTAAYFRLPYWLQLTSSLLIIFALGVSELLTPGGVGAAALYFLAAVVFATMLATPRIGAIAAGASVLSMILVGTLVYAMRIPVPGAFFEPGSWAAAAGATLVFSVGIVAAFLYLQDEAAQAQNRITDSLAQVEATRASLEQSVASRTEQLRAVFDVSHAATSILDPDELTTRVVELISERLGYYYAAIFLVDEAGEQAELRHATGEAGRILRENKHRLQVGGQSMVGSAISTRQPRIALDTGSEPARFDNPLLPYTRSEVALPLLIGERVLGALDVQSTKAGAFGPSEVQTLQGMADQVAIAYENARLFAESRRNLAELEAIQRQYISSAWKPLMGDQNLAYKVGDEDLSPQAPEIEVPLSLRDEVIGAINLSGESDWTPEQRNLIEAVATQTALALENARLVDASQAAARREHMLAEITTRVWSSSSIEAVLRTAVEELGQALGADEAQIELKVEEDYD